MIDIVSFILVKIILNHPNCYSTNSKPILYIVLVSQILTKCG